MAEKFHFLGERKDDIFSTSFNFSFQTSLKDYECRWKREKGNE